MGDLLEPVPEDWRAYPELELPPTLAGALAAFQEQGYHGTSVRDIASRIGMTVPALYYHHGSKEGTLVALLAGSVGHLAGRVRVAVAAAGPDPVDQFANFVECVVLFMTHRGALAGLDSEIRALSAPNRRAYAKVRKQVEDSCRGIVAAGVESGDFTVAHVEDTVRALLGMLQAIATWFDVNGALTPEEIASRYVEICLQTVGSRRTPAAAATAPSPARARRR
ncbi:MAG: TetR/AcrR family transcriptional regulator [Sporichthyaceae bacterium]